MQSKFVALKARHEELEDAIAEERNRIAPNALLVQLLKRQKLRLKDRMYRMSVD
jgi:hypothetical protein